MQKKIAVISEKAQVYSRLESEGASRSQAGNHAFRYWSKSGKGVKKYLIIEKVFDTYSPLWRWCKKRKTGQ
ncbi:MAG: hypothetical protein AB1724_18460 [Thermodesulfobacteriota bacterium]